MTRINTFEDILQAMEQDPALRDAMRRHLLLDDLLHLPARVSALETFTADLAQKLSDLTDLVSQFIEQTTQAFTQVNQRLDRIEADVADLKAGQTELRADVAELKTGQAELKAGQTELRADVAELKTGQAELKAGQTELRADFSDLKTAQVKMSSQLDNLTGTDLERQAARLASRRARQHLDVNRAELLLALTVPDHPEFRDLLNDAAAEGIISDQEADDLQQADLVLRGTTPNGVTTNVVAEVSVTIGTDDILRASQRAAIMAQASGQPTLAAVMGQSLPPEHQPLSDSLGVSFLPVPQEQNPDRQMST